MCALVFQVEQADIVPAEMVFTIKELPKLGHVVKLTNSSSDEGSATPVLDYIHAFTQDDVDRGHILYVSASIQVTPPLLSLAPLITPQHCCRFVFTLLFLKGKFVKVPCY